MNFLFSDIFERNKKVRYHNKQAILSYDGVMVSVIVSSAVNLHGYIVCSIDIGSNQRL
jgi:uncharacterized membrane protein